ncbi:putative HTH-type transcriptional regulator/GBAA_1941/BAS1801 [Roseovarius aestuarii]|uniref:Putative HTH-type transcriptional regulator/GBAA_1941/BAS1801 n=2 Tax=Roseovarius aestuarii TaxID=475083 RepID=A0A1X7BNV3_9RHOB|nr:putative HTH-type transcriptional regulator/GBAA_1941/BAS1801 [Roseovarius aestuarii]
MQPGKGYWEKILSEARGCLMVEGKTQKIPPQGFDLKSFFPYQTRVFYKHVIQAVSRVYEARYDMKPNEWRTLAILGSGNPSTPAEIVELSSIDKVSVSRAVTNLSKRGWILVRANRSDARSKVLTLSKAGKAVYHDLVPRMLEAEVELLSVLTDAEVSELKRLMEKLHSVADKPA